VVAFYCPVVFTGRNFSPAAHNRLGVALAVFRRGIDLARRDHEILLVLAATFLVNAAFMVNRLFPKQLVSLGFPYNPVLWYAALLIVSSGVGFLALHFVEARVDAVGAARRFYALACLIGTAGLLVLAAAPIALVGGVGVLLAKGIADSVTRPISVIWVNRRTPSDVRATLHSFLSQAESVGEVSGGLVLAGIAQASGVAWTIAAAAGLIGITGLIVTRSAARYE